MPTIKTALSDLLNVDVPILCAPMAVDGTVDLASAVTSAGGFGMMGSGFRSSKVLREEMQIIRDRLRLSPGKPIPIAVGFLGWVLDRAPDDPLLEEVLDEKPVAVCLAFGDDLGKYVARIHAHDSKRAHKTIIFVNVNSVEMAVKAANEWKVDVIVAQDRHRIWGHGGAHAPPLFSLVPAILDALPRGPLVVGAGGIANGKQIAALLTLGADGVLLGTRFLFTPECKYSPQKKEVLIKAGLHDTVRTLAYDEVGRTNFWPADVDGRAVSNSVMEDLNAGLDLETRLKKFDESASTGDSSHLIVWAGVGVGLTDKITPASDIVHDLRRETLEVLNKAAKLVSVRRDDPL
ncbi:2-nitropropane dioxygenase [Gymnopilus junonius]|uniref:2-nitropropane dioxygenase n=1 Tax=Gymnopilus junonius TaxID=109634 RepID=A0A9P5TT08_GYMJU|nr:2-nitropropane dioxygenase [Gymnopilus junonius]